MTTGGSKVLDVLYSWWKLGKSDDVGVIILISGCAEWSGKRVGASLARRLESVPIIVDITLIFLRYEKEGLFRFHKGKSCCI